MADESVVIDTEVKETGIPVVANADPFNEASWSETPPEAKQPAPNTSTEEVAETTSTKPNVNAIDIEKETGYKTFEEIKAAREELATFKQQQKDAGFKFTNEESKKLFEAWQAGDHDKVLDYLNTAKTLANAANLDAQNAIKLHLKQTNPHYKDADIQDVFDDRYSLPKKPVQLSGEEDEEFKERETEYNTRVAKINRAIERDAVAAKGELAKLNKELVLPPISTATQENSPSQEELTKAANFLESYTKSIPEALKGFNGYSTTFKDDVTEIPISFNVTDDDRKYVQQIAESFAQNGFNANALFAKKWMNTDGSINVKQMGEDLYLLQNKDKIFQKIANESGSKRLAHQLKLNSNINVTGEKRTSVINKPDEKKAQIDAIWNG